MGSKTLESVGLVIFISLTLYSYFPQSVSINILSPILISSNFYSLFAISPCKVFIISLFLAISSVAYCISLFYSAIELSSTYLSFYNLVNSLFRLSKSILWRAALSLSSYYYLFYISLNISCLDLFIIACW